MSREQTLLSNELLISGLSFMQCANCNTPAILKVLSTIKEVALIIHSPTGCAASFVDFNRNCRFGIKKRGLPLRNAWLVSTNLDEKDIVCGIDEKLEEAIRETLKQFKPRVIFVAASCGSGITGYEIQQVIESLQDKLPVPLVTITCEIYGHKKWGSGFDGLKYGVFPKIIKPGKPKKDFFNLIDFSGNDSIRKLLSESGIKWNFISCYEDYECLERMAQAKATFRITSDRFSVYTANYLEQEFGVPNIKVPVPCGFQATDLCLREKIGKAVEKENVLEKVILCRRKKYEPQLRELRRKLKGIRALPIVEGDLNESKIFAMLRELELPIPDCEHRYAGAEERNGGQPSRIRQGYQLIQWVQAIKPDIIIVQHYSFTSWGARMGYPTFWLEGDQVFFGYQGMVKFGQKIWDVMANPGFVQRLSRHVELPYTDWWLQEKLSGEV